MQAARISREEMNKLSYADFLGWLSFSTMKEKETTATQVYLAQIAAILAGKKNIKECILDFEEREEAKPLDLTKNKNLFLLLLGVNKKNDSKGG